MAIITEKQIAEYEWSQFRPPTPRPFKLAMEEYERALIFAAIRHAGTISGAAKVLEMTRQNLHKLIRKHRLVFDPRTGRIRGEPQICPPLPRSNE